MRRVRWLTAFIDRPATSFSAAAVFWAEVTGSTPPAAGDDRDEFVTLIPGDGDAFLLPQRTADGAAGSHIDVHVDDVVGVPSSGCSAGPISIPRRTGRPRRSRRAVRAGAT